MKGTGYGALAAVNGVGDFVASAAGGALWAWVPAAVGFGYAAITGAAGAFVLLRLR